MIRLTEKVIAVEVSNDGNVQEFSVMERGRKVHVFDNYFDYVNPNSGDYARGYMCGSATESGLSLLESKGLDINKKYAIIKIEK